MTLSELRLVEDALDDCAARGMGLDEARRFVSARILGLELHESFEFADINFCEAACLEFLGEERKR